MPRKSPQTVKKVIYNPVVMLLLGLVAGVLTRLADIYTQILCSEFSELSVWILIGVVIVLFCDSRRRACLDIFLFCAGMLVTYYLAAEYTHGIWGWSFVCRWAVFTLLTPAMAYLTWLARFRGVWGWLISAGICGVALAYTLILAPELYNAVVCLALIYLLLVRKKKSRSFERDFSYAG